MLDFGFRGPSCRAIWGLGVSGFRKFEFGVKWLEVPSADPMATCASTTCKGRFWEGFWNLKEPASVV